MIQNSAGLHRIRQKIATKCYFNIENLHYSLPLDTACPDLHYKMQITNRTKVVHGLTHCAQKLQSAGGPEDIRLHLL